MCSSGARTHLRRRPLRAATDATGHTLLDTRPDLPLFRYFRDARPADEEWRFAAVELLGTIAAVRHRLLEGAGVAVLPRYFVSDLLESRRLTALLPDTPLPQDWFRLVWRNGHPHGPHLRALGTELAARPLG